MSDEITVTFTDDESAAIAEVLNVAIATGWLQALTDARGPGFLLSVRRAAAKFFDAHARLLEDPAARDEAMKIAAAARAADDQLAAEIRRRA